MAQLIKELFFEEERKELKFKKFQWDKMDNEHNRMYSWLFKRPHNSTSKVSSFTKCSEPPDEQYSSSTTEHNNTTGNEDNSAYKSTSQKIVMKHILGPIYKNCYAFPQTNPKVNGVISCPLGYYTCTVIFENFNKILLKKNSTFSISFL